MTLLTALAILLVLISVAQMVITLCILNILALQAKVFAELARMIVNKWELN